jgi:hypothetical protein
MQSLTDDLLDILESKFQAAASGFRGRVEIDYVIPGVPPDTVPDVVQEKSVTASTDTQLSFDDLVTVGNLVVAVLVSREVYPTMADGSWTLIGSATGEADYAYKAGLLTAVRVYARVATSTSAVVAREATGNKMWMYAFELSGADIAAVTVLEADDQAAGPLDLGTFTSATGVAVMACGIGRQTDQANNGFACTPGTGWTELKDQSITPGPFGGTEPWIYYAKATPSSENLDATATITATEGGQDVGNWGGVAVLFGASGGTDDTLDTEALQPSRISKDKSRRLGSSQATVEVPNEAGQLDLSPDGHIKSHHPIRIYQWYGDAANEVLTFTGLIDEVHEGRDPRTVVITARDMMKRLIVQTFSATAPQGDGEDGAVRTAANGVYLDTDVDTILDDILDRAGWPTADRDITPSGFPLEEYIIADGSTWAEAIIGENALTGLTGYDAGVDEAGVFYFRPLTASAAPDSDTEPTPDYTYEVANADASNLTSGNVIRLDHEIDDYDLKTRVKVRGSLATAVPAFTELWHTNLFTLPVGVWYDPTQSTHLRVLDRGTKKIYNLVQATRAKDGTGIYPIDISGDVTYPLGLSGDPADSDVFWVLEARWRVGGGNTASVHKYDASDGTHSAEYALPDGQWSDIKVSSGSIWLANYGDDLIYQRSKVDASAVASFTMTYAGTDQTAPTGIGVDGTTLALFFYGKARFLLVDESDPTTGDPTNALGVGTVGDPDSARIKTGTTKLLGGEIDTDTDAHLYACSDDLGLVYKYALTEPSTSEVAIEVVDTDLEDELGFLAGAEDREHDTHPGDADHPFEIRRETLTLAKTITDLAQATETANRALAVLAHRREVVDVGTVGNPGIQLGDLHQLTDPVTGLDDLYVVDTYRDDMTLSSDGKGTYLATVAYVPYSPSY